MIVDKTKLWHMSSNDFNEWRRNNDLPKLLSFFDRILPFFKERKQSYKLTNEIIISHDHTWDFFIWDEEAIFVKIEEKYWNLENLQIVSPTWLEIMKNHFSDSIKIEIYTKFIPYFHWLHTFKNTKYFICPNDPNKSATDNFVYRWRRWGSTIQPILMHEFEVLSIWWIQVDWSKFQWRNLDFLGLDKLTIINGISWNRFSKIQFSSCNDFVFKDIGSKGLFSWWSGAFLKIHTCHVNNIKIYNSNIQDLHFYNCWSVPFTEITKCRLRNLKFNQTTPSIEHMANIEFINLIIDDIEPEKKISISKFYEKIVLSYSQFWDYHNAGKMYYKKKLYEMKSYFFCKFLYSQKQQFRHLYDGVITWKNFIRQLRFSIKNLSFSSIFKWISLLFSFLIWWFWERPFRTIYFIICSIIIFSFVSYSFSRDMQIIIDNFKNAILSFIWQKNDIKISEALFSVYGLIAFWYLIAWLTGKRSY